MGVTVDMWTPGPTRRSAAEQLARILRAVAARLDPTTELDELGRICSTSRGPAGGTHPADPANTDEGDRRSAATAVPAL